MPQSKQLVVSGEGTSGSCTQSPTCFSDDRRLTKPWIFVGLPECEGLCRWRCDVSELGGRLSGQESSLKPNWQGFVRMNRNLPPQFGNRPVRSPNCQYRFPEACGRPAAQLLPSARILVCHVHAPRHRLVITLWPLGAWGVKVSPARGLHTCPMATWSQLHPSHPDNASEGLNYQD